MSKSGEELTAALDTIYSNQIFNESERLEFGGNSSDNRFTSHRGYRLNHYAIKALLARVYLYAGDQTNALKYSAELIGLFNQRLFSYDSKYTIKNDGNMKLYKDVLFSLYNNFEHENFNFVNPLIDATRDAEYLSLNDFNGIFGNDVSADCRSQQYLLISNNYVPIKYQEIKTGQKATNSTRMIPMLRMSEIFYIAAECYYDEYKSYAEYYLATVRKARGVRANLPSTTSKADFIQQIVNDVRREQFGEGQLFFFYKRLNLPVHVKDGQTIELGDKFVFPIPDSNNHL